MYEQRQGASIWDEGSMDNMPPHLEWILPPIFFFFKQ